MKIALFGSVTEAQLSNLKKTTHVVLVSDHPSDKKVAELLAKLKITTVVARAEWHNIEHETSVVDTRMSYTTNEPEQYNKNGGHTRDAVMVEHADAVILGEGVSESRRKLVAASELPVQHLAAPKMTQAEAQAELDRLFS